MNGNVENGRSSQPEKDEQVDDDSPRVQEVNSKTELKEESEKYESRLDINKQETDDLIVDDIDDFFDD